MKEIPWLEKNIIYRGTKYRWPGHTIEEITQPWDLYLESCFLETSFGNSFHILAVQERIEKIFSIRDEKREPIADIITMPVDAKRYDSYWPKVRILKTSNPMIVNDEKLIVLDVIGKKEKRASLDCIELTKELFKKNGGVLGGEHPNKFIVSEGKNLKKWRRIWNGQKPYNLCISSQFAYANVTQIQVYSLEKAIEILHTGCFDELYINVDDSWVEQLMEYLKVNKGARPEKTWHFFGNVEKINKYLELVSKWRTLNL